MSRNGDYGQQMLFTKMHGIGNDYIYMHCPDGTPPFIEQLSIEMSRPHTGVGADGIILILPSEVADFRMRIFNADGSEARMCGNGSRCVAKYVHDYGLTDKSVITLETLSGIKTLTLHPEADGSVNSVTVDMGFPSLLCPEIPVNHNADRMIDSPVATSAGELSLTAVSMGNPHGVVFLDSLEGFDVHGIGRELETHPMWPDRANIEFAVVTAPGEITMRVWERGSGETMACGTGACAVAVAAFTTGRAPRRCRIKLRGGNLDIEITPQRNVLMTGPAATVFEGRYFLKD